MPYKNPWTDRDHLWLSPAVSDETRKKLQAQNLGSLNRKITFNLNRPNERIQFQHVEGWTTRQILDHMVDRGLDPKRIQAALPRGEAAAR